MKKTNPNLASPAPATKTPAAAKTAAKPPTAIGSTPLKRPSRTKASPPEVFRTNPTTTITVRADVGFGNLLYLRGEGGGLSWDRGVPLQNAASDLWTIALDGATSPVKFKLLINDQTWSAGEDYVAEPGKATTVEPRF